MVQRNTEITSTTANNTIKMQSEYNRLRELFYNFYNNRKRDATKGQFAYKNGNGTYSGFIHQSPDYGPQGQTEVKWTSSINLSRNARSRNVRFYLQSGTDCIATIQQKKSPLLLQVGNYIVGEKANTMAGINSQTLIHDVAFERDSNLGRSVVIEVNKYTQSGKCVWLCVLTNGNVIDVSFQGIHDPSNHGMPVCGPSPSGNHVISNIHVNNVPFVDVTDTMIGSQSYPVDHQLYPFVPTGNQQLQEKSYNLKEDYSDLLYENYNDDKRLCVHNWLKLNTEADEFLNTEIALDQNSVLLDSVYNKAYDQNGNVINGLTYLNDEDNDYGRYYGLKLFFVCVELGSLNEVGDYPENETVYIKSAVADYWTDPGGTSWQVFEGNTGPVYNQIRVTFKIDNNSVPEGIQTGNVAFNEDATDYNNPGPDNYEVISAVISENTWNSSPSND